MNEPNEPNFIEIAPLHSLALNELSRIVTDWATKKGWNEAEDDWTPRQKLMHRAEMLALMHSELSECLEFLRKKEQPAMDDHVPDLTGEAAELADVLIRIFHYCGKYGIDIGEAVRLKHAYNITRPFRHGKRS